MPQAKVSHCYREANFCADALARIGASSPPVCNRFVTPPPPPPLLPQLLLFCFMILWDCIVTGLALVILVYFFRSVLILSSISPKKEKRRHFVWSYQRLLFFFFFFWSPLLLLIITHSQISFLFLFICFRSNTLFLFDTSIFEMGIELNSKYLHLKHHKLLVEL